MASILSVSSRNAEIPPGMDASAGAKATNAFWVIAIFLSNSSQPCPKSSSHSNAGCAKWLSRNRQASRVGNPVVAPPNSPKTSGRRTKVVLVCLANFELRQLNFARTPYSSVPAPSFHTWQALVPAQNCRKYRTNRQPEKSAVREGESR